MRFGERDGVGCHEVLLRWIDIQRKHGVRLSQSIVCKATLAVASGFVD